MRRLHRLLSECLYCAVWLCGWLRRCEDRASKRAEWHWLRARGYSAAELRQRRARS